MPNPKQPGGTDAKKPPGQLLDEIDEQENDCVAAEEASEVEEGDEAAVEAARDERIPTAPVP